LAPESCLNIIAHSCRRFGCHPIFNIKLEPSYGRILFQIKSLLVLRGTGLLLCSAQLKSTPVKWRYVHVKTYRFGVNTRSCAFFADVDMVACVGAWLDWLGTCVLRRLVGGYLGQDTAKCESFYGFIEGNRKQIGR
jgi:hypothetical protein